MPCFLLFAKDDGYSVPLQGLLKPFSGVCQSWHLLTRVDKSIQLGKARPSFRKQQRERSHASLLQNLGQPEEPGTLEEKLWETLLLLN